ncbi:hypothetical protein BLA60_19345 [Actinophytocola xinjiangensis]|uniref:FtsX extracellular domain-containing protein n=1 Tax=Actinophytocola xinjiangensis TaxID=485602 RepID=A0A7Z0WL22_9PSEU|nr:permease-like cell division protein FtsX [Actinophytocola xinjiangensis]OLF09334.1 hypothetical protein BLA60_19345 [Actinophytocola xinjiangensis]
MTKRVVLLVVGALLVGAGALVATLRITGGQDPPPAEARTTPTTSATVGEDDVICLIIGGEFQVRIYFADDDADATMSRAAERLRADPRVQEVATETRAQAYERFTELFSEQDPELVALTGPEDMSATVDVAPVEGVTTAELAQALETELTVYSKIEERACRTR